MYRMLILVFIFVLFTGCGVSTSSSSSQDNDSNSTNYPTTSDDNIGSDIIYLVDSNQINDGTDIGDGIVYIDPNPIGDGCNCEDDNQTDGGQTDGGQTSSGNSIFDKVNAIEDPKACYLGDYNDGETNNILKDDNKDYIYKTDSEDGISVQSRYTSFGAAENSEVVVFYYDLKPSRTMQMKTVTYDSFSVSIDTAWAQNDEKVFYIRTPKNDDGLYGCYHLDVSTIAVDGNVAITKVYRLDR